MTSPTASCIPGRARRRTSGLPSRGAGHGIRPTRRSTPGRHALHPAGKHSVPGIRPHEFRAAIAEAPAGQHELLQRACDWAESLQRDGLAELVISCGSTGIVSLMPGCPTTAPGLSASTATSSPPACSSREASSNAARRTRSRGRSGPGSRTDARQRHSYDAARTNRRPYWRPCREAARRGINLSNGVPAWNQLR
jgi:hypothetical protein